MILSSLRVRRAINIFTILLFDSTSQSSKYHLKTFLIHQNLDRQLKFMTLVMVYAEILLYQAESRYKHV